MQLRLSLYTFFESVPRGNSKVNALIARWTSAGRSVSGYTCVCECVYVCISSWQRQLRSLHDHLRLIKHDYPCETRFANGTKVTMDPIPPPFIISQPILYSKYLIGIDAKKEEAERERKMVSFLFRIGYRIISAAFLWNKITEKRERFWSRWIEKSGRIFARVHAGAR